MNEPLKAPHPPNKRWVGFVHLHARFYMDYHKAVLKAAGRKKHRAVDIDTQKSKDGTLWALHWGSVGRNHLHDPSGSIKKHDRIEHLTDEQIAGLRGPTGQTPYHLLDLLSLAHLYRVRVEVELKMRAPEGIILDLITSPKVAAMNGRGDLQFKTLASLAGSIERLSPAHRAGGTTILSFTGYRGRGIYKSVAWPVVDYVRGKPKWR